MVQGWRSLWRGNSATVARIAPFSAIQFTTNDFFAAKFHVNKFLTPIILSEIRVSVLNVLQSFCPAIVMTVLCFNPFSYEIINKESDKHMTA
jgi:hypothetical protein